MSTEIKGTCPSGDGSLRWPCPAHPSHMGELHQHLLDMLGAKDHVDAGRIIGELHAAALIEHSGNSGQLQPPTAAVGLNEPFGDSEQLARPDAGSGGDALDVPFAWTWISQAGERHVTTSERHTRNVAGADGCVVHAITPQMLAARQPVGEPVASIDARHLSIMKGKDGTLSGNVLRFGASMQPGDALLYIAPPAKADRMAIKMLVAAGFVSEDKANESLRIAHGFGGDLGQPTPAVAGLPAQCVYAMNTGEQDGHGHELYVLTDKPIPLSDYELLYRSAPAQPAPDDDDETPEPTALDIAYAKGYGDGIKDGERKPAPAAVPVDEIKAARSAYSAVKFYSTGETSTGEVIRMNSTDYLRQYLAAHPSPLAPAAVPVDGDVARLQSVIERDRTAFCALIMQLKKVLQARSWMCEQHARAAGGYAYDEPGFIKEFGAAWEEIMAELHRVHSVFRDFADCPVDAGAVSAAQAEATTMLATHSQPAAVGDEARPMVTAPRDGTMLRLLVEFTDHATEDTNGAAWTIGANSFEETGEDQWQFAGWCWTHDHFTEGKGTPVGWLPLIDQQAKPEVQ